MSEEPIWLTVERSSPCTTSNCAGPAVRPGFATRALLESALDRPRNKWAYEQADASCELAAAYGLGIARNHPFVDGNKRTALMAICTFLGVNDVDFVVPEADAATDHPRPRRRRGERGEPHALDQGQLAEGVAPAARLIADVA